MAKAYFKCAECGASVQTSGHNRSDADRRAAWREAQGHLCSDCEAKHRAIENAKAAESNQAAGLPALRGSEKQVAWAETIRSAKLSALEMIVQLAVNIGDGDRVDHSQEELAAIREKNIALIKSRQDGHIWQMHLPEFMRAVRHGDRAAALLDLVRGMTKASWWIDNRDTMPARIAFELRADIDAAIAARHPVPEEEAAAMHDAQAEALLKPSREPQSQQVAEISVACSGKELRVAFAEKREDFRLLMRGMGFRWADRYWSRPLNFMQGDPTDRAAETAHRILGLGYMVRLHDDEARAKALSGHFEPGQTRWVVKATGGAYDGWCKVVWPKSDDLYEPAKRILGARYKDGAIYCPPGSIIEVADFAERYGFAMSEAAMKMLTEHQAALASGVVVNNIKKVPARLVDNGAKPNLVAEDVGIDDELKD